MTAVLRSNRQTWLRAVLGVFVLAFVAVALQPCAMAMEPAPLPDCPNCPTEPASAAGCDPAAADCMVDNPLQVELRSAKLQPLDDEGAAPFVYVPVAFSWPPAPACALLVPLEEGSPPSAGGPPLNVRFCVYLM